jgi:hypothetical protein
VCVKIIAVLISLKFQYSINSSFCDPLEVFLKKQNVQVSPYFEVIMSHDGGCPPAVTGVLFVLLSEKITSNIGSLDSVTGVLLTSLAGYISHSSGCQQARTGSVFASLAVIALFNIICSAFLVHWELAAVSVALWTKLLACLS